MTKPYFQHTQRGIKKMQSINILAQDLMFIQYKILFEKNYSSKSKNSLKINNNTQ